MSIAVPLAMGAQAGLDYWSSLKNQSLQRETNALNYRMWQEGLEYNKPVNQRKRLEEAGLNPALMYGTGSAATTGAPPPRADAPEQGPVRLDPGAIVQMQQARLVGEQAQLVREQAKAQKLDNAAIEAIPGATRRDSAPMRAAREALNSAPRLKEIFRSVKESPTPIRTLSESATPSMSGVRSALESFTPMWMHKAWLRMKEAGRPYAPKGSRK